MRIRDVTPDDVRSIFEIYNREIREGLAVFTTEEVDAEAQKEWLAARANRRHPCLVAEDDGEILGFAYLSRWSVKCGYDRAVENSIYVNRAAQGRGVGNALMHELVIRARETGADVIIARVESSGAARNRLHLAHGFQLIGVMHRIGMKFGQVLDVNLYELLLDALDD